MSLGIAETAIPSASYPPLAFSDSAGWSDFVPPTDEFEVDPLPFANIAEDSPLQDSYNTSPASWSVWSHPHSCVHPMHNDGDNDNARDYRSLDSFSSAVPSSTSFDDSNSTLGYVEDFLSPAGLEVHTLSLCIRESYNLFHSFRSDPDLPSRVNTLGSGLHPSFVQPLHDSPTLDDKLGYAMNTPTGVVWLADLSPADDYNSQSEPEPPDPSCASH